MSEQNTAAPAAPESAVVDSQTDAPDTIESTDDVAAPAAAAPAADLSKKEQKELAKELKKYKLKIDGKEEEVDEDQVVKYAQMGKASQKRMQEAAELRRAAEEFVDMLRKNPKKVLSDPNIGVDLKKFAQEIINEEIENSQKSPEQLEIEKLKKELEDRIDKDKTETEKRKRDELSKMEQEAVVKLENDIEGALNSNELPKTPYTVRKMAEIMMIALDNNIDLSAKDVIPILRKQMEGDIKELFSASSDDVLEAMIGKDRISSMRKKQVAKMKQAGDTANSIKPTGSNEVVKPKDEKKMTIREFLKI